MKLNKRKKFISEVARGLFIAFTLIQLLLKTHISNFSKISYYKTYFI